MKIIDKIIIYLYFNKLFFLKHDMNNMIFKLLSSMYFFYCKYT